MALHAHGETQAVAPRALGELDDVPLTAEQVALAVPRSLPRPDLVWSGPEVPGLHARDTRRVYEELFGSAERSVWASTYAFFDGLRAFEVLARRMDARPDLRVILLLNIQRRRGDTTAAEQVVRRFCRSFLDEGLARLVSAARVLRPAVARAGRPGGGASIDLFQELTARASG
jgi:hypothetical protein